MYSNKENINILTSLLIEWGVTDAVVCPGSRNAAIVHNLSECGTISCHPITDERSAAFYAMGMALCTKRPTVVCVTSGSALLNTAPAVAEAYYQHVPLIVIAADRPQQWIDQLDGQTLPQPDALNRFVRHSVSLPEPRNEEERWYCNRLVNEAMHAATFRQPAPVLINVPITEPLFTFDTSKLPEERRFRMLDSDVTLTDATIEALQQELFKAKRPLIVVGQMAADGFGSSPFDIGELAKHFVVFAEPLSNSSSETIHFDEAVRRLTTHPEQQDGECDDASRYAPDHIIYIGDTLVSKATRRWLRQTQAPSCLVTADPLNACDPLMSLRHIVTCSNADLKLLMPALCDIYTHSDRYADNEAAWCNEESRKNTGTIGEVCSKSGQTMPKIRARILANGCCEIPGATDRKCICAHQHPLRQQHRRTSRLHLRQTLCLVQPRCERHRRIAIYSSRLRRRKRRPKRLHHRRP